VKERNPLDTNRFQKIARTFSGDFDIIVDTTTVNCDYNPTTKLLRIPANSEDMDERTQDVIEGEVDHELLHGRAEKRAELRRAAGERIVLPSEAMHGLPDAKHRQLFNVVKDIADETDGAREFVGMARHLDSLNEFGAALNKKALREGRMSPWRQVTVGAILKTRGQPVTWLPTEAQTLISKLDPELAEAQFCTDAEQQVALVYRIMAKLEELAKEPEPKEPEDSKGEGKKSDQKKDSSEDKQPDKSESSEEGESDGEDEDTEGDSGEGEEEGESESEEGKSEEGEGDEESDSQPGSGEDDPVSREAAKAALDSVEDCDDLAKLTREALASSAKDEARKKQRHIPHPRALALDRVMVAPLTERYKTRYGQLMQEVRPAVSALRAKLITLLRVQEACRITPDKDEGELDVTQLYRLFGSTPDRHIFFEEEPGKKLSTAISILRDFSGSMKYSGKARLEQMSCIAIAEALDQLHIPTEIIGFSNPYSIDISYEDELIYNRREPFLFRVYKSFTESYRNVKARLADTDDDHIGGDNADCEAIMFAARRLAAYRGVNRRLLVVLSDGQPAAFGDMDLLREATKETVKRVTKAGIECVGVGIMSDSVTHYYPDWCVVHDVEELPKAMFRVLKQKLVAHGRVRSAA
jgi:cobalamin biosynthesis protein CobT